MPIYEYQCDDANCGYKFEDLRNAEDREEPEACPVCERGFVRLVISVIGYTPMCWGDTKRKSQI